MVIIPNDAGLHRGPMLVAGEKRPALAVAADTGGLLLVVDPETCTVLR